MSPSSQRAWIEIAKPQRQDQPKPVALLAEGVDRNLRCFRPCYRLAVSPSSQRAWIEILFGLRCFCYFSVALLAEGVDRNLFF